MSLKAVGGHGYFDNIIAPGDESTSQQALHILMGASSERTSSGVSSTPTTTVVLLTATVECYFRFGDSSVVAKGGVAGDNYLPANVPTLFGIKPGQYVAAISGGSGGVLHITQGKGG